MPVVKESIKGGGRKVYIWNVFYSCRILIVAVINDYSELGGEGSWAGDWAAYIDEVPGIDHKEEWRRVAELGEKLDQEFADYFFGEQVQRFADVPYRE